MYTEKWIFELNSGKIVGVFLLKKSILKSCQQATFEKLTNHNGKLFLLVLCTNIWTGWKSFILIKFLT